MRLFWIVGSPVWQARRIKCSSSGFALLVFCFLFAYLFGCNEPTGETAHVSVINITVRIHFARIAAILGEVIGVLFVHGIEPNASCK